ncbi:MAG: septum formation initiator family protein [Verrucomicrobia bacterium]|nr:septum formation initiator family protein [Verrucomicrobiota bacterium]
MNNFYRYVALSVILLALIGVGFAFLPKVGQFRSYQETKRNLEEDIRAEEERIKELRLNQERFSTDKHFVQKIAHEIGFAHEGEMIFQFNDQPDTNRPLIIHLGADE